MIKFTRGYDPVQEKVKKSYRYLRSCDNCKFFYAPRGSKEELCNNPNVLEYDICIEESRVFCSFWQVNE